MNDGVEIRMETVITGVYGDGSVIDNNAAGCMEPSCSASIVKIPPAI